MPTPRSSAARPGMSRRRCPLLARGAECHERPGVVVTTTHTLSSPPVTFHGTEVDVREFTVQTANPVTDEENLTDMVWANAERFGDAVSFQRHVDGTWVDLTARDFAAHVLAVAKGLVAMGIQAGDRVCLMS